MSSISFSEPGSFKVGRTNGSGTRVAPERASSQTARPELKVSVKRLEWIGRNLLLAIGEDPTREGLKMTPNRFARWWKEFIDYDPGTIETTFAFESFRTDQMVVCAGVPVFSLCEHHLLPFKCEISMAYIATEHVLGLSKFARIAHKYSHRLQVRNGWFIRSLTRSRPSQTRVTWQYLHAASIFACKCAESRAMD